MGTLTSGRTCTPTPSCPEAPPCTPVSLTACRRRSPPWPPPPSRSRSSLPPRGSTPSGSEAPSWLPCPPSSRCGSPSRNTTRQAPPSSTASASKYQPPSRSGSEPRETALLSWDILLHLLHCNDMKPQEKLRETTPTPQRVGETPTCECKMYINCYLLMTSTMRVFQRAQPVGGDLTTRPFSPAFSLLAPQYRPTQHL